MLFNLIVQSCTVSRIFIYIFSFSINSCEFVNLLGFLDILSKEVSQGPGKRRIKAGTIRSVLHVSSFYSYLFTWKHCFLLESFYWELLVWCTIFILYIYKCGLLPVDGDPSFELHSKGLSSPVLICIEFFLKVSSKLSLLN